MELFVVNHIIKIIHVFHLHQINTTVENKYEQLQFNVIGQKSNIYENALLLNNAIYII
jgi:hypothetical protein